MQQHSHSFRFGDWQIEDIAVEVLGVRTTAIEVVRNLEYQAICTSILALQQ